MNLTQMKRYKQQMGYSLDQLSKLSGVPRGTLQKIFSGETKSPRYETLQAIEKVLKPAQKEDMATYFYGDTEHETQNWYIKEPAAKYGYEAGVGGFTLDDYYALPDQQRVELIDGVFYDMAAPSLKHQLVTGRFFSAFSAYIAKKGGDCVPLFSPVDVNLDKDSRTMVQPDFLVVCDKDKLKEKYIYGAPDFIVEILSPATRRKDMFLKLGKYAEAGVREYWIVDAEKERILVYFFEEDDVPTIYGIEDEIPVRIFSGELRLLVKQLFGID